MLCYSMLRWVCGSCSRLCDDGSQVGKTREGRKEIAREWSSLHDAECNFPAEGKSACASIEEGAMEGLSGGQFSDETYRSLVMLRLQTSNSGES